MTLDTINETRTFLLLVPYILLYIYYIKYVRDQFFIKSRADVQLLFMIYFAMIAFAEMFAWSVIFNDVPFMGMDGITSKGKYNTEDSAQSIGILIGAAAAVIGWLFTTRAQAIDSTKANTMNILMESRFSDEYARNLKATTAIFTSQRNLNGDNCTLSVQNYAALSPSQLDSIHYMLNYFEFIAVGIRCGDLDEVFMKKSLRSIILTNYHFYKAIIEERQKKVASALENFVALAERWD